jgi:single-strand DNA-binding protein
MINRFCGTGRLTRDPELRYTQNGTAVTNFTLAIQRNFKNQNGDYDADFINHVAFRKTAEIAANHLKKGDQCGIEGRLQSRSYENNDGRKVFVTEVVVDNLTFLEPRNSGGNGSQSNNNGGQFNDDPFGGGNIDISPDDLPF